MKARILLLLITCIIISGCSNQEKNEPQNKQSETLTVNKVSDKTSVKTVNDMFTDPHFKITNFTLTDKNKMILYKVDFMLDEESLKYIKLNKNEIIYLNILYPENINKKYNKSYSPSIKVRLGDIDALRFEITDNIPSSEINKLRDLDTNLQLQVLDKNEQMFFLFDGLNNYNLDNR
ncbi:hypothetical protein GTN31_11505 [Macrococcoides canis]|uniref:hypothetical protein n=1 Tax=Macrococcoides canis TaxID=1855823 RepID=UPI0013E94865|nr:hypothetical protein [Macrococcus canis]QIH76949.1 hypothetical protein GTN31_11505 [Macrococcus canis]